MAFAVMIRRGVSGRLIPAMIALSAAPAAGAYLRPADAADLESRYGCGGGGTYAPETGIRWYREWDGCYVKYPSRVGMPHKMWTVGKMDYRPTTMRGGPSYVVLTLPFPGTYAPEATIVSSIFEGEAPHIQQTLQYSADHLGNVWSIANEPNWGPYFPPAVYARHFHNYATGIKGLDPTARIATGGLLVSNEYTGPTSSAGYWRDWIDQFRAEYQKLYGSPPPVDVWDIHPYDSPLYSGRTSPARKTINNIVAMRRYLDNSGLAGAEISISEIACFTSDDLAQVDFINELFAWLNANAELYRVRRWFWWISTTQVYPSGLFDGAYDRAHINVKGDAYMRQMGRVFVDPAWTPEPARIRGSMRNPYGSLEEVRAAFEAGTDGLRAGNIVYDFSTGRSYVLMPSPRADLDRDGDVDGADFGAFCACFEGAGEAVGESGWIADLNGDHFVDGVDYSTFAACYNGSGNPPACR